MSASLRLERLLIWVQDVQRARRFYHESLGMQQEKSGLRLADGTRIELCSGRVPCTARGPHGIVPAFLVEDVAQAKAWLRAQGRPILFEEVVPGLARVTSMDPAGNAFDLVQELDASRWQRGMRIPDVSGIAPPTVLALFELSVYVRDTANTLHFFRDTLGLEVGLAYFGHVHLLLGDVSLVIRPTWRQCEVTREHTSALVLSGGLPERIWAMCQAQGKHMEFEGAVCGRLCRGCLDGEHTWVYWCS